jgi:glycolate oxidase iron-sulfur subunit
MTGYDACVRCGLCLPACPTYLETMTETSGPRGRIRLMKAVDEGDLDLLSPGFVEQMSQCLGCRACEAACPSGVPYGELLATARARIATAREPGLSFAARWMRRFAVRGLFGNLALLRRAASLLRFAQRSGLMNLARVTPLRDQAMLAPRIPDRFFPHDDRAFDVVAAQGTALLHVGCIMGVAFPQVHEATVRLLQRAGLRVAIARDSACCGAIAEHAGDPEFARELARRNIAAFERSGADVYAVNAAGCGASLKEYGALLADDPGWGERARFFSSRVRDVLEILDAVDLAPPAGSIDARVTYQEPCHLVHAQRISAAPRRLLAKIPGLQLVEMRESALCCGSAGVYNLTQPEMAMRLGERKADNVADTGAAIVATANPGCAMQLTASLRAGGYRARVAHVVELLDEAYEARTPGA